MAHCYKHVIESTKCVRRLIGGSSNTSFQLNERQCQILAEELVKINAFLGKKSACLKFGEGVECIILQHLCSTIKKAEVLVKKCCCKDLESWLVSAMMLVEIQEEFMKIILDIHLWRMLLDFVITCGRGLSREKKVEEMKTIEDKYHQLFKDLRRESHALQQAAVEDKATIISRSSRIANVHGSTSGLDYLRAIYLQSWLTGSASYRNMELTTYEFVSVLGQGGCGTVLKVKWLGVECALKVLLGQDEKEAIALKGLFHPNIIRLFHYWEGCPKSPQSHLFMELMPQDLGAYMRGLLKNMSSSKMQMGKDSMPFSLPIAIDIMYQIAQAMHYMHDKHLTHRDLKPANILVKERSQTDLTCIDGAKYLDVKLADFGLVKSYNNTSTFQAHSRNKGTGMYRAPEIFGKDMTQKRHYLPMIDVWSFGITCAEILSGKQAYVEYVDKSDSDIQAMIKEKGLRPTLPKHCPPYLAFCIKSCWELLPFRRPCFASICKLLRHAQLLSLGVTKLDDTKVFFAYTTRSDQVQSLDLSASSSKAKISTFLQSSLKFLGIGPRAVPNAAEASLMHEVRLVQTPLITEDSPELDEDIGGGIATPESLVGGERHYSAVLPGTDILHEEPAQLTQASLGTAISPPHASDPIQPAIMPQKKLGRIMVTTKADGGKFAKDCETEEVVAVTPSGSLAEICGTKEEREEAVNPSGHHPNINPDRKNKKPIRLLSQIQDWLEGKSAERELPKFRKAVSAGNSPVAFSLNQSITFPKLSPPTDLEVIQRPSSSSSRGDRNNGSREAVGYQFRAPPPGSYQHDDMEPSPKNLLMAIIGVRCAVDRFAKVLITSMNKHQVVFKYLNQKIFGEVTVDMDRADHCKFLVQAFICKRLFDGFDAPNGYFGVEYFETDQMTKLVSFADFSKFKNKASTISMLLDSDSPDDSFLGRFCFKKFKSLFVGLPINPFSTIYPEELDAIEKGYHPKTVFYQSFLKVAVSVWLVHRLVHSFEEKVEMLIYENGAQFHRQTMESVVPGSYEEENEEADVNTEVGFSVIPGFQVSRSVVKCIVYLRSRNRPTDMEISGETSTETSPGKTSSAKSSVTLHTPELPLDDSHSPGSLQPPEGFGSFSHCVDHYPPTGVEDAGSSGLEVHPCEDARRDSFTPANQESVNRSGRKSIYEQESFAEALAGSHDRVNSIHKIPPPPARSSEHRGHRYAALFKTDATRRRLENTRHRSRSM